MTDEVKLEQLRTGFAFPSAVFIVDYPTTVNYRKAVEDASPVYQNSSCVPPMAIAALAMATMGKQMSLPDGSIHVTQDFAFHRTVSHGEKLISWAKVIRNVSRGKLHLLNVNIEVYNQLNEKVLTAETGFILPQV